MRLFFWSKDNGEPTFVFHTWTSKTILIPRSSLAIIELSLEGLSRNLRGAPLKSLDSFLNNGVPSHFEMGG